MAALAMVSALGVDVGDFFEKLWELASEEGRSQKDSARKY